MAKLWAFGCSFTYGHALRDCFDPKTNGPGGTPSAYAWPKLLGTRLNLETENQGKCGADNRSILSTIMECHNAFGPDDTVIILWTYHNRYSFFTKDQMRYVTTQVTPWGVKQWTRKTGEVMATNNNKRWGEYHAYFSSPHNDRVNTVMIANTTIGYLKTKVKKVIQCSIEPLVTDYFTKELMLYPIADNWSNLVDDTSTGLDDSHPSETAHQAFANAIYKVWEKHE